jgi:hypothetical protein
MAELIVPVPAAGRAWFLPEAARPYLLLGALLLYTPALLYADSRVASVEQQYLLGLLTLALLVACTRSSPPPERRLVWLCVVIATGVEVFASLIWGEYRYRFGNVPLFVPFGHGLVCFFALRAARTPLMQRHGRSIAMLALAVAGLWAVAGLSLIPWVFGGRKDTGGGLLFPIFALFVLFSSRAGIFAAIFVATSVLELFGTGLGSWTWAVSAPVVEFHAGNPPSVVAGAYCVLDGAVLAAAALTARAAGRLRPLLSATLARA